MRARSMLTATIYDKHLSGMQIPFRNATRHSISSSSGGAAHFTMGQLLLCFAWVLRSLEDPGIRHKAGKLRHPIGFEWQSGINQHKQP